MRLGPAIALWRGIATAHAALPRLVGAGYALPPLRVAILVTHRCNLRCSMCVVPGSHRVGTPELDTPEVKRVLNQAPPGAMVTLTGGEPLLRSDLEEILRWGTTSHRVHLVSNGVLLDARWAETLAAMAPDGWRGKGLLSVGISIHGVGAVHDGIVGADGAYQEAMAAVVELAGRRKGRLPLVDLKVVMTRHNVGRLVDLYREAWKAGADVCSLQIQSNQLSSYGVSQTDQSVHLRYPPPVEGVDVGTLREEVKAIRALAGSGGPVVRFSPDISLEALLDHYRDTVRLQRHICYSTWSTLHVAPTGEVYPCFSYSMGNVKDASLDSIWNGSAYRRFRLELRKRGVFPGCVGCCVLGERRLSRGRT